VRFVFFLLLIAAQTCFAGARHFTFLYGAPTSAPGTFELENYAATLFANSAFTGIDFRHELEIGITSHFQASIYIANWSYDHDQHAVHYDSASAEFIYNLTNPVTDFAGISLYEELGGGRRAFESETKLIAQKNFGPLILLYNFTVEAEWESEALREDNGELQQAFGASYEINSRLSFGLEMLHEIILPDWQQERSGTNFFLGPNFSYRGDHWFTALSALKQLTGTQGEPIIRFASSLAWHCEKLYLVRPSRAARFGVRDDQLQPASSFS
jgi:hypothetical protein